MALSWVPRGRFLGSRNEAKMVALLGASCGRYFHDFFMNFGGYLEGKMEPSLYQIGVQ